MEVFGTGGIEHLIQKLQADCFCLDTGTITSLPKVITDARLDASYVVENTYIFNDMDIGWVTTEGKLVLYGTLPTGTTKPSVKLIMRRCSGMTADPVSVSITQHTSSGTNGNYIHAEGQNLIPGTQYSWRLMKVVDGGDDVQVYSVGATPHSPTYNMYFYEVPRSLEDGESYYVTLKTTAGSETPAQSTSIEFEGTTGGGS